MAQFYQNQAKIWKPSQNYGSVLSKLGKTWKPRQSIENKAKKQRYKFTKSKLDKNMDSQNQNYDEMWILSIKTSQKHKLLLSKIGKNQEKHEKLGKNIN